MIDLPSMSRRIGDEGKGIFPAAWDAALFQHKIADSTMVGTAITSNEARELEQTFESAYKEAGGAHLLTPASVTCFQLNRLLSILNWRTAELQDLMIKQSNPDVIERQNALKKVIDDTTFKLNDLMKAFVPPTMPIAKSILPLKEEAIPKSHIKLPVNDDDIKPGGVPIRGVRPPERVTLIQIRQRTNDIKIKLLIKKQKIN